MTLALGFVGLLLGVFVGAGVLVGDEQGRVNLLFLLLLFAFLPVLTLVLSLVLLFTKKNGPTAFLVDLPIWPKAFRKTQRNLELSLPRRSWLFFESQVLSLAFAVGSILVFIVLLLGTDINFVWRSTLLDATDLLPALQLIASPWVFWTEAQPGLGLLQASQDFRIGASANGYSQNWWQFVLAAQLTYNLIPRALLLIFAHWQYSRHSHVDAETQPTAVRKPPQANDETLAPIVNILSDKYQLLDWGNAPEHCHHFIEAAFGRPIECLTISTTDLTSLTEPGKNTAQVLLVKSWEPPLGELKDVLDRLDHETEKFILPLDWDESAVTATNAVHLQEWQRFAASLGPWKILQPGEPT